MNKQQSRRIRAVVKKPAHSPAILLPPGLMTDSFSNPMARLGAGSPHLLEATQYLHPYSFAGLSDIYQNFMLDISGAAEIPVTKLFGRSPAGLNATGQGDMDNYSDSIEEKQESELRPILDRLLPILLMSEFGAVPDDFDYEFEPYRRPSEEERKNISINVANSVATAFNAGIINQQIALKELKESSRTTGMWSNISDEDISAADTSFAGGEDLPQPYFGGSTEQPETV